MFVMFKFFDNLDEGVSLLKMLFFCEEFWTNNEFVDSFAIIKVEPELNIILIAEEVRFHLS